MLKLYNAPPPPPPFQNSGSVCQCQLLAVVGCLSTMKIVVDASFCRNQHFLVGITCRNRVIPGLESAGQWRAIAAVIVVSSCWYRRQPAKSSTTVFTETVITRNSRIVNVELLSIIVSSHTVWRGTKSRVTESRYMYMYTYIYGYISLSVICYMTNPINIIQRWVVWSQGSRWSMWSNWYNLMCLM